jgi:hypothetical protein
MTRIRTLTLATPLAVLLAIGTGLMGWTQEPESLERPGFSAPPAAGETVTPVSSPPRRLGAGSASGGGNKGTNASSSSTTGAVKRESRQPRVPLNKREPAKPRA